MLEDNGRIPKQRHNYFMSLHELGQLLNYLRNYYDPKFELMILIELGLGLRCSEAAAISIHDFTDDFKFLNYRQAKTNKMIYKEPVPETVRLKIKEYIRLNSHRLINGYLFGTNNGKGFFYSTETIGAFWSKWRRGCAKFYNNPAWLEKYNVNGRIVRYRIGSHSLRRLHRTYLASKLQNDFIVAKICHYNDIKTLTIYRNEFELLEQRDSLILPVMNPLMADLDKEVVNVPYQEAASNPVIKAKPLLKDN